MSRPARFLSAALLAALVSASLPGVCAAAPARSLYSAPAKPAAPQAAEPSAADEPAPASSAAMEEKFRKLQKEMQGEAAAAPAPEKPAPARDAASVGGLALQIFFGLAFVLLLAVVTIRVLKRLQGGLLSRPGKTGDLLEVLETCHLGPQQKVIAVRMHEDVGILGVTKDGINLLTLLKQPADDIRRAREGESNSAAFSDNLNKLLDRFKKPKKVSDMLNEGQG